ncbi:hypothetical protein [Streptomyces sp. NPDC012888]
MPAQAGPAVAETARRARVLLREPVLDAVDPMRSEGAGPAGQAGTAR